MTTTFFRNVASCSLVEIYHHFTAADSLHAATMAVVRILETSVRFYESTRASIPEDTLKTFDAVYTVT